MPRKKVKTQRQKVRPARRDRPGAQAPPEPLPHEKVGLTEQQYTFCLEYLANGFNASAAYKKAHPGVTDGTARTEGWRSLTNPDIRAFLKQRMDGPWKARQLDGEEALALVAGDAVADVRLLYDAKGAFLKPQDWPDEIAQSVEAIEFNEDGSVKKVKLAGKLAARRIILEQTGKLKTGDTGIDQLAAALRETMTQHTKP